MKKYLLIVEGKSDIFFIKDYLISLNSDFNMIENNLKNKKKPNEVLIKSPDIQIKILMSGGYNQLKNIKKQLNMDIDQGYNKLFVIQDADNPNKRDGGVENRNIYLTQQKKDLNINFESFLFPNNKDDGDLETLLLKITNDKNYNNFYKCNDDYRINIHKISEKFSYELDEDKYKIFHYFRTFYGSDNAKEENRVYAKEYWDFSHDALKPLKDFIRKEMNII